MSYDEIDEWDLRKKWNWDINVECTMTQGSVRKMWIDRLIWSIFTEVVWNFEGNWTTLNIDHKMWKIKYKSECDKNECIAKLPKDGLNDLRNFKWTFCH